LRGNWKSEAIESRMARCHQVHPRSKAAGSCPPSFA
jgi:hypothetical protein